MLSKFWVYIIWVLFMLQLWCFEIPRKPYNVVVNLQTHRVLLLKWKDCVKRSWVLQGGVFCISVNFFPSNRGMCKNMYAALYLHAALALCEWSYCERADLAVCCCMALRASVSLHSKAVEVPHVPPGWSCLGTEEGGLSFVFEEIVLNQMSVNMAHIWPKLGDCFVNFCMCVCAHHCLFCSRTAA